MESSENVNDLSGKTLTIEQMLDEESAALCLEVLAGKAGLQRHLREPRIQKYSLAFTGYFEYLQPRRLQVLGETELSYLQTLSLERQEQVSSDLFAHRIPCAVVTKGLAVPDCILRQAERQGVVLLRSSLATGELILRLSAYLETRLAPETTVHGVLIDVYGIGVLIIGKSGIGKSECALHLVVRGHRLVADDVITVRRLGSILLGSSNAVLHHNMEIRGLGIINVRDLFGIAAIRYRKKIELVVLLEMWEAGMEYERLGLEESYHTILGVNVPFLRTPVLPGRNIPTIIEVAARNQILKIMGSHSARAFEAQLAQQLVRPSLQPMYLEDEAE